MKNAFLRLIAFFLAFCAVTSAATLAVPAYATGSKADPLVTKSYIEQKLIPQIMDLAATKVSAAFGAIFQKTLSRLNLFGANSANLATLAENAAQSRLRSGQLTLKTGDTLTGSPGTLVTLISGTCAAAGKPVIDITDGVEIAAGAQLKIRHRFMLTEVAGSGVRAVSDAVLTVEGGSTLTGSGTAVPSSGSYTARYKTYADALSKMGIFRGTDKGFELERSGTRLEGLIMLIRLNGSDASALKADPKTNPFKDVPVWASNQAQRYVGFAYTQGLTKGVSSDRFDPSSPLAAEHYATFVLRALGYSDSNDGKADFKWQDAADKLTDLGIISPNEAIEIKTTFRRDQIVLISYRALSATLKGSETTLLDRLIQSGAVDRNAAVSAMGG